MRSRRRPRNPELIDSLDFWEAGCNPDDEPDPEEMEAWRQERAGRRDPRREGQQLALPVEAAMPPRNRAAARRARAGEEVAAASPPVGMQESAAQARRRRRHPPVPPPLSGFQGMWLFALFDLPVTTRKLRRAYARFRKALLKEGFVMLQYSVYARYNASEESTTALRRRLREQLPQYGQVRLLAITDHQFGKQEVFVGKREKEPENVPEQLFFF